MPSKECFPGSTATELPRCAQALLAPEAELPDSRVALGQPLSKSGSSGLVGLASLESVHAHRAIL